ncbi:minor capsid protein [Lachnospiraceae bacterium LCP19S3_B12]
MNSATYWKNRETEQRKHDIRDEAEYQKHIQEIYQNMIDEIEKEINGFYGKYAGKEGITITDARKRAAKADIEALGRKAAKYVKEKDFSDQANEEMRLYNMTMKVNRLELLKAQIGLEMVAGFDELQKYYDEVLTDRAVSEFERQAGILGRTIQDNAKAVNAIVNASFHNATYSDRIWMYQDMLKNELSSLLQTGLIQGQHPRKLATHLRKRFGVSQSNAELLMTTELARVQTEAQKQSFDRNGFEEYTFLALGTACPICRALDEKHFKVTKMLPGTNAPPMHPRCRCSTAAYMDSKEYEAWIGSYEQHKMPFHEWKNKNNSGILSASNTKEDIQVHSVGKISKDIYECITEDIITDEVIITDERIAHIIERRGQKFYDTYRDSFADIIRNPDYIFADKKNTALVCKEFESDDKFVNIVLRIVVSTDNPDYKNSIITAVGENRKRFQQRLRNNTPLYKKE